MSRKKSKKPEQLDLIRRYIIDGEPTGSTDLDQKAQAIRQIYPILLEFPSTRQAVDEIMAQTNLSYQKAFNMVQLTEKVYGMIRHRDKEGRKAILIDIMYESLSAAKAAGDYNAASRLGDKIAKMEGFYEQSKTIMHLYKNLDLPPVVVSDDPMILELEEADVKEVSE
jgi:hypothetical protein